MNVSNGGGSLTRDDEDNLESGGMGMDKYTAA
jgi:hypothetical protein